jgi:hypothetical protein
MSTVSGLKFYETIAPPALSLALQLFDAFTGESTVYGSLDVSIAGQPAPTQMPGQSAFLFYDLPAGTYTISVASAEEPPYYFPTSILVTLPVASIQNSSTGTSISWPAFPDISKADLTIPLNDPAQNPAYLDERAQAGLSPTPKYPFPPDATLVRGVVSNGSTPVQGVNVQCSDAVAQVTTDGNGEFVLIFESLSATVNGTSSLVTQKSEVVNASFGETQKSATVQVMRGMTASVQIQLTP